MGPRRPRRGGHRDGGCGVKHELEVRSPLLPTRSRCSARPVRALWRHRRVLCRCWNASRRSIPRIVRSVSCPLHGRRCGVAPGQHAAPHRRHAQPSRLSGPAHRAVHWAASRGSLCRQPAPSGCCAFGGQEVHDAAFTSTDLVHGLRRSSRSGFSGHDCGCCITAYGVANALQRGVRKIL